MSLNAIETSEYQTEYAVSDPEISNRPKGHKSLATRQAIRKAAAQHTNGRILRNKTFIAVYLLRNGLSEPGTPAAASE
jgi:hypothetical protein